MNTTDQSVGDLFPAGGKFLHLVSEVESKCVTETLAQLPALGISAPLCFEALGTVLSKLYAEASCAHGCNGGDHFWQQLIARVSSNALASLRLATSGYYDESISLTRGIGEIANLLFLFAAKPETTESWRTGDDRERKRQFGPVKVRLTLEELGLRPPIDESRYSLLCEVGVHITPGVRPQSFDLHERASLGATFREAEFIVAVNELALVVAEAAACISVLPQVAMRALSLRVASEVLLNAIGGLDLNASRKGAADDV